jgi:hypothetical protein|nr:MAG TPA: hypothetical protein [Caudoviricetes sp.]DAT01594.1 MAG TPA: hypothetical protein [Caudoviricetes sp.]
MDEMIRYIFNSLGNVEGNMSTVVKALKKQKAFNGRAVIFAAAVTMYMFAQHADYRKEIADLKSEIKKLKNTEGDQ